MRGRGRLIVFAVIGLLSIWVLIDSLAIFDTKSYYEVPHGNHTHYLPKGCDPRLNVSQAPMRRPGPGETIDCQGLIVRE
ncbi:MAG: hypothetical protein IIA50_03165 [Bacteroidetes bacterium]|nr:hypothetical protein [Bacteroidota bacterium]